jgi:hypothetical protein
MYIALIFHSPFKYCKYFKCHGAWEDHLIFDDRHQCLNKVHYHYMYSTQEMRAKLHLSLLYGGRHLIRLQYVYKIINNVIFPKRLIGYLVTRSQMHC